MIAKIPPWVFVVFVVLLYAGWRQSRTRRVAPGLVIGVALGMLGLSLYGVLAAFGAHTGPLLAWGLGYAASATLGAAVFAPRDLARVDGAIQVPGSWVPLGLMMGIFAAKFVLGFLQGIGSPIVTEPAVAAGASLVFGLLSGGFAARALAVHRFARSTTRPAIA